MVKKNVVGLVALVILVTATVGAEAQVFPGFGMGLGNWAVTAAPGRIPGFYADLGIRKFINSFASWQIADVHGGVIVYSPLSRLEFPIDEWFYGLKLSQCCSCFSFNAEFWSRLNKWGGLRAQDSDWTDVAFPPDQKTIFSSGKERLPEAFLVDLNVECAPFSAHWASLVGVVGYRWQTFHMIRYDERFQHSLIPADNHPLPRSDALDERFYFKDWFYLGGKGYFNFGLFELTLQGDYGWLNATLSDRHLHRHNSRWDINGPGHAWNLSATLARAITNFMSLRLEYDFKRISTSNCTQTADIWNRAGTVLTARGPNPGAKIWSDQQSIAGYAEFRF